MAIILLHTAEIRWFLREPSEAEHVDWFLRGQHIDTGGSWERRTDRYLLFPGCESIGVKERESRFEIKALRGASEPVQYPNDVSGRLDCWVKWSYGEEPVRDWIRALRLEQDGWIEINKERILRKFSLDSGVPEEVSTEQQPVDGCNVEVTKVGVVGEPGDVWLSLGLEGFGPPGNVRRNLHQVAERFFSRNKPPWPIHTANSCSYPVWLSRLH